jgi:hypothetical protein
VAAGALLPGLLRRAWVRRTLLAYLLTLSITLCTLALAGLLGASDWAVKLADQRDIAPETLRTFLYWLLGFGVASLAVIGWARTRRIGTAVVLVTALLWVTYGFGLAPTLDADSSARRLMQRVGERIGPQARLGMVAWREQNLLQSDRPATDFGFKASWQEQWAAAAHWVAEDPPGRWLFVLDKALSPCVDAAQVVDIGTSNRNRWLLVPGTALDPDCRTPSFDGETIEVP